MNTKDIVKYLNLFGGVDRREVVQELFSSPEEILEHLFESYFKQVEGVTCCCDKASFTATRVLRASERKETISLQVNIELEKDRDTGKYKTQHPYWCPKTFENTDEAIELARAVLSMDAKRVRELVEKGKQIMKAKGRG